MIACLPVTRPTRALTWVRLVDRDSYPLLLYTNVREGGVDQLTRARATELPNQVPILPPAELLPVGHFQHRYVTFVEAIGRISLCAVRSSWAVVGGVGANVEALHVVHPSGTLPVRVEVATPSKNFVVGPRFPPAKPSRIGAEECIEITGYLALPLLRGLFRHTC